MIKNVIAIIGKTNTGKSTLFNKIIKKKRSIVTNKKNTTQNCIIEILKKYIIIDTPGPIIKNNNTNINNINKNIYDAINKSNIILINIDILNLSSEDFFILELIKKYKIKKILLLNKCDKINNKNILLPFIKNIKEKYKDIINIFPISNLKNINIEKIENIIINTTTHLDKNNFFYTEKNKNYSFIIKELVRETLLNKLEKEIPYAIKIELDQDNINKNLKEIFITLNITKINQKKIIIGSNGQKIKNISNDIKNKLLKIFKLLKIVKINIHLKKK